MAFTAAGTARVSGAFHTCVERVLGVVAGVVAGYLTLSAQYSVESATAGRALNVTLFAAWCFVCTLSRTSGPDWSYTALCAAFTAPVMQLDVDLNTIRSGIVFSLAWDAVVQNVSGVVVLVIVDLLLVPQRASKLANASLHAGVEALHQGFVLIWDSFINETCTGCRYRAAHEVSARCTEAAAAFAAHRTLAREAFREPTLWPPYFPLRIHEQTNKQARRLLRLLHLLQNTLDVSAMSAAEQFTNLMHPLSRELHELEGSMMDSFQQVITGMEMLLGEESPASAQLVVDVDSAAAHATPRSLPVMFVLQVRTSTMRQAVERLQHGLANRVHALRSLQSTSSPTTARHGSEVRDLFRSSSADEFGNDNDEPNTCVYRAPSSRDRVAQPYRPRPLLVQQAESGGAAPRRIIKSEAIVTCNALCYISSKCIDQLEALGTSTSQVRSARRPTSSNCSTSHWWCFFVSFA